MKATITFDLDDKFEKEAHLRAIKATDAYLALYSFREYLENKLKYSEDETSINYITTQIIFNKLLEELDHYSIDLDNELS